MKEDSNRGKRAKEEMNGNTKESTGRETQRQGEVKDKRNKMNKGNKKERQRMREFE